MGGSMETWDLLNANGDKIGKTIEKTVQLPTGQYHLGVDVWIKNSDGEYLIQKRAVSKKRAPGKWMYTCGSVLSGENGIDAVVREVAEELGVEVNIEQSMLLFKTRFADCINEVWLLQQDVEISSVRLQLSEVSEVKWASKSEINAMLNNKEIEYGAKYIDAVFQEEKSNNMLTEDND
jgi:8-oxo-dGTP diphosphatase